MRNNHFFKTQILLAAIAAAVIAPFCAFAQQKTAPRTAASIKDSDIYVPDKALEPSYTKKEASDILKEYIAAFGAPDMPNTYEAFARNPEKYKRIGTRQIKSAMANLYSYVKDSEIQEVTEATDTWFKNLYNKALELNEPAKMMDNAIRLKNATMYAQARKLYDEKYDELKQFVRKTPDRLSNAELKKITEANRAKRRAEYIALRKQQILEQEEAARKAIEEENKKAAGSKKK
ncbi:MAG: hypothetical protein IJT68_08065 [Lentisphaeria bacterium]|nr:hypothetical protein [Lentisphaeria bacterium]MBR3507096.1 hypothetical protein [Lentisphaeria bacterium]